jgi:hypothetical protein
LSTLSAASAESVDLEKADDAAHKKDIHCVNVLPGNIDRLGRASRERKKWTIGQKRVTQGAFSA